MYGLCPPNFYRIGSLCYFISREKLNWLDAHFECKDKNSKLAEPGKITDRQLRKYLIAADESECIPTTTLISSRSLLHHSVFSSG